MLLTWIKKNKKLASKIMGVNFLLMALVVLFWAQPKEGMTANERAAANLARMEAKVQGSSKKPVSSAGDFSRSQEKYQRKQVRIFLLLMFILGLGFLGYGFIKKEEKE